MPRQPRGAYVRNTPDRFLAKAAIGGVYYFSSVGSVSAVGLYNNATDGSSLHIYGLWVFADGEGPIIWSRQSGATGTHAGPCFPVITRVAALPGALYYEDRAGISFSPIPVATAYYNYMVGGDEGANAFNLQDGGPLCVLQPGDALYGQGLYTSTSPSEIGITFHYCALRDIGEI